MVVIRNYLAMWLFVLIANTVTSVESRKILNIAVILPDNNAYPFSIDRVKPGLSIAVKTIKTLELLSDNYDLHVNYADSRCSFVYPINEAINFYVRKELDVIFGPFCDYAAAPLARQITFWSIPMLTAGAMAADFARYRLLHYPLLTRIGPNFISLTQFLSTMLRGYKWNIVQLLYDPYGQGYFEDKFCHIASDSIHYGLKDEFKAPYQKFEKTEDLLTELGTVLGVNVADHFVLSDLT
ncbi:atrial natriuretic peptide receptor 3 isoform X2 [Octopus bimaculoides]|uniref:atrial natriuretic peptide receptor 3 isoform X2 n=1 Tax=Octopus bimaculoides TaxID=37653 RepID=UPI0022E495C6|nr:atrial natriuretic peptide receptor 3 isoform X2 [Octopus bimaculoides]